MYQKETFGPEFGPEDRVMIVYEFYVRDKTKGKTLIGILPERRKVRERITHDSIMNWARLTFDHSFDLKEIFYDTITLCQDEFGNYYPEEEKLRICLR